MPVGAGRDPDAVGAWSCFATTAQLEHIATYRAA